VTPPGKDWNEASLSEDPAVAVLEALGFTYVGPEVIEAERDTLKETVLSGRLEKALTKLNPWLSADNAKKVVRSLTGLQAASLIEASEKVYTRLTYGMAIEQDGQPSRNVRFFDFERPANNDLIVTRQLAVKGVKKHIIPDVVVLRERRPARGDRVQVSPTLGEGWKHEAIDQFSRYQELDDKYRELGAPRLFETVQVLVATCLQDAVYGTSPRPSASTREWKDPVAARARPPSSASWVGRPRRRTCPLRACSRPRRCSISCVTSWCSSGTRRPAARSRSCRATSSSRP
jgi:type I restriction enzyme R subunit